MNRARKRLLLSCLIIAPFLALWLVRARGAPGSAVRLGQTTRSIDTAPSVTVTPTSFPGSPHLLQPAEGALLLQPVPPDAWVFSWEGCSGPCTYTITISGPGGRLIEQGGMIVHSYTYTSTTPLPDDALGPWQWQVSVQRNDFSNISETRSFYVMSVMPTTSILSPVAHLPIARRPTELAGAPDLPDLTIDGMSIGLETGGACNYPSTQLGVRVWFRNIGVAAAGPFDIDVNGVRRFVAGGLAAGASDELWFQGYVYGKENIAIVDASYLVAEKDETNNRRAQALPIPTLPLPCTPTPTP